MNGYNFTDRVRKVLQMAREEAARLAAESAQTAIRESEERYRALSARLCYGFFRCPIKFLP